MLAAHCPLLAGMLQSSSNVKQQKASCSSATVSRGGRPHPTMASAAAAATCTSTAGCSHDHHQFRPNRHTQFCHLVMTAQPSQRKCVKGSTNAAASKSHQGSRYRSRHSPVLLHATSIRHTHTHTRPNKAGRHHCCCQRAQGLPRLRCSAAQVPACCPAGMLRSRPCLLALLLCTHVPAAHWAAPSALLSHSLIGQPSCALPQKEATPAIGPLMRLASCMSLGTAGHTHEPQQQPSTAQQQHGQPKAWSAATQHAQPTCWWLVLVVQMLCAGGACCCCQCLAHRAAVHVFRRRAPAAAPNTCQHAEMVGEASSHKRSGGPHGTHALRTKRATAAYAASA